MSTPPLHKLFWIGSPFFAPALTACGWQVHLFNFEDAAVYGWDDLVRMAGWEPDVVLVADKSRPPFVLGMEEFPCVTVFYCVDSHIHSYYPLYAQAFDVCLMSLKDHMPRFLGKELSAEQLWWFPAFAPDTAPESTAGEGAAPVSCAEPAAFLWDCLFVGTVNAATNPARAAFMSALAQRVPGLHVTRGNYRSLFPQGRVLLNHCAAGDLNFRVFEALGCGGCLLTPAVGHGQQELFTENVHLLTYPSQDVDAAAVQVQRLLADPPLQQALRQAGLASINAAHRASHRAQEFTRRIHTWYVEKGQKRSLQRRLRARDIRRQWLRMPYLLFAEHVAHPLLQEAYVQASRGAFKS